MARNAAACTKVLKYILNSYLEFKCGVSSHIYLYINIYIFFFTKGVAFFRKLTNVAWYLDPHIPKFIERRLKMPKIIMGLYDDVDKMELATSPQSFIG